MTPDKNAGLRFVLLAVSALMSSMAFIRAHDAILRVERAIDLIILDKCADYYD